MPSPPALALWLVTFNRSLLAVICAEPVERFYLHVFFCAQRVIVSSRARAPGGGARVSFSMSTHQGTRPPLVPFVVCGYWVGRVV
eukprot:scaffold12208_cov133-Isochrysis_galbana.AAC.2